MSALVRGVQARPVRTPVPVEDGRMGARAPAPDRRPAAVPADRDRDRGRHRARPTAAGAKLLSSRALASQLGVSRNTVVAAYDELCMRGWIAMEPTRGAFVVGVPTRGRSARRASTLRTRAAGLRPRPPTSARGRRAPRRPPACCSLLGGVPELRDLPHRQLARAYRSALSGRSARRLLDYAHPQGNVELRTALADVMAQRPRRRGTAGRDHRRARQPARPLSRRARAAAPGRRRRRRAARLPPGVAARSSSPARRSCRFPSTRDGLDVDALEPLCATTPVRAVYTTPHHQYPSTVTLTAARRTRAPRARAPPPDDRPRGRLRLTTSTTRAARCCRSRRPIAPASSSTSARSRRVSRPACASATSSPPPAVIQRIAAYRGSFDGQGDHALERAIATLLEDGEVQRHVRRALKRISRAPRRAVRGAARAAARSSTSPSPHGGMALWARAPGIDTDAWVRRGLEHGVAFQAGCDSRFDAAPSDSRAPRLLGVQRGRARAGRRAPRARAALTWTGRLSRNWLCTDPRCVCEHCRMQRFVSPLDFSSPRAAAHQPDRRRRALEPADRRLHRPTLTVTASPITTVARRADHDHRDRDELHDRRPAVVAAGPKPAKVTSTTTSTTSPTTRPAGRRRSRTARAASSVPACTRCASCSRRARTRRSRRWSRRP